MGLRKALTNLDMFGSTFNISMGVGADKKKTLFGAFFSLLLMGAAIAYFVYLNYQYATNLMPKITSTEKRIREKIELDYTSLNTAFGVYYNDDDGNTKVIEDYEKEKKLKLLKYQVTLKYFDEKETDEKTQDIPFKNCKSVLSEEEVEDSFTGDSQCIDVSSLSDALKVLKTYPKTAAGVDSVLSIQISTCIGEQGCVDDEDELTKMIFNDDTYFELTLNLEQLDSYSGEMQYKTTTFDWNFDQNLFVIGSIELVSTHSNLLTGFLVAKELKTYYFSDASSSDTYRFKKDGVNQKDKDGNPVQKVATINITLGGKQTFEVIQYALYPSVLAEFGSIIATKVSKSEITSVFMEQKLKDYYKTNAYKILNEKNNKEQMKKDANEVLSANNQVEGNNTFEILQKKFKMGFLSQCFKSLKSETRDDFYGKKRSEKDVYEVLYYDSNRAGDIFEIHKELITMRKVFGLLLTPEQYAAIKCCGSAVDDQIPFLLDRNLEKEQKQPRTVVGQNRGSLSQSEEKNLSQVKRQLNHLQQIDKIDYDRHFFESSIFNFFKESKEGFNQYDDHSKRFNERLLECLNRTYSLSDNPSSASQRSPEMNPILSNQNTNSPINTAYPAGTKVDEIELV